MSDSVEAAIQQAAASATATGTATPIVIKEDRSVVVPTAMQQIAVQCDNEANVLHFVCPRNWADIDLAAATLYINVVKPDKSIVAFVCTNVVSSEDTITFDWVVTEPVTDVVGKLSFLVCARDPGDPGNGYRWHSNLCDSLFVAPGIVCVVPSDTPDPPHIPLYGTDTTLTKPHVPADAAAVGEQLSSLSEKVANLPQPDWNQNDSTAADYVRNRPFYTGAPVETVLVEESTVEFVEQDGLYAAEVPSTFEATVGEAYKVYWDGETYECICVNLGEALALGNTSIFGFGSDTGEPFFIIVFHNGMGIGTVNTSASHTFSISGLDREIVKIDEKYLPENVANKSEVEAAQTVAEAAQTVANSNKETLSELFASVITFTFDKQTSGRDTFVFNAFNYYKISDFNPSKEDVISFKGTRENGEKFSDITIGSNCVEYGFFIVVASAGACSLPVTNTVTKRFTAPSAGLYARYAEGNTWQTAGTGEFTLMSIDGLTIKSSTYGSTKKFRITVNDSGTISATEVV